MTPWLRIRDWDSRFEKNRTKELSVMTWRPEPTDLSDDVYTAIVDHPDGAAHFGVLTALRNVAARGKPRGTLTMENGAPHTAETLARKTRLPESVIQTAITRLLSIGELENVNRKSRIKNRIRPQEVAAIPQAEEKRRQTPPTPEEKTQERAEALSVTNGSGAPKSDSLKPVNEVLSGGGGKPAEQWASPEDELRAIYQQQAGEEITIDVLDSVRSNLAAINVSMSDFVDEIRKRARGKKWETPPGLLKHVSKNLRRLSRKASPAVTAAGAAEKDYKCPQCFSKIPGRGVLLVDGKSVPCTCASPEYIAEQVQRGVIDASAAVVM